MSPTRYKTSQTFQLRLLEPLLHTGFALTGVATVLLGTILPRVSTQWHLRDKDAGLVLLVQFATSAFGALLARRNLWKTLAGGYAVCAAGAIAIFLLQQSAFPLFLAAFGIFGLGLGLAMTSTNLLVGRRHTNRRGAKLALLNFAWSAGAVACPVVVARFFEHTPAGSLFGLAGLLLLPFALLPMIARKSSWHTVADSQSTAGNPGEARTIIYFALMAFLYVGVEATIGNWISTYATRAAVWTLVGSSMAVAAFWAALLLGRGLTPLWLRFLNERRLYQTSVVLVICGVALLLSAQNAKTVLAGAALTGIALAPLFPLTIPLFLAEIGESRNASWVFGLAGLGGAAFSWLTGFVSTDMGSLRIGLLVPGVAALLMMALILWREPTIAKQSTLQPGPRPSLQG